MSLLSAGWLVLLLPWAVLAVWLLRGRVEDRAVTAVFLWPRDAPRASRSRRRRPPPAWVILLLAAVLLTIVALAGPALHARGEQRVTIVVDVGPDSAARSAELARRLRALHDRLGPGRSIRLRNLPADGVDATVTTAAALLRPPRFAPRRPDDLGVVIEAELRRGAVVVALTAAPLAPRPGLFVLNLAGSFSNAGFDSAAVRWRPPMQVMTRVVNDTSAAITRLWVVEDGQRRSTPIDPIEPGQAGDRFIDLIAAPAIVELRLDATDEMPWDDAATVVRPPGRARLELGESVPEPLRRLAEAWSAARGEAVGSEAVLITRRDPGSGVSLQWMPEAIVQGSTRIAVHPALEQVRLPPTLRGGSLPADERWTDVAWVEDRVVVQLREVPARAARVAIALDGFAADIRFVVLATALLDWLAQPPTFSRAESIDDRPPAVASPFDPPGVVAVDGHPRAFNRGFVSPRAADGLETSDWIDAVATASGQQPRTMSWLLYAIGCIAAVAGLVLRAVKRHRA